jgi:uncharacterized protein YndB with AHSA1/START domain
MEKATFRTTIDASREKVWKTLWDEETYKKWTSPFSPGSHAETDWRQGSRITFIDMNGDGMISEIAELRPNEFMSFRHLGEIKDGKEDFESDKVKQFAGSTENYTLRDKGGSTEVTVEMEIDSEYRDFFDKTWPRALEHLKMLSEEEEVEA